MKFIFLTAIKIYWLIPKSSRRKCLFKYSCSHYVYNTTRQEGLIKGLHALRQRIRQCRPGYTFYNLEGKEFVLLQDNTVVERKEMNL